MSSKRLQMLLAGLLVMGSALAETVPLPESGLFSQLSQTEVARGSFTQQRFIVDFPFPINSSGEYLYWREQGLYWATLTPLFQANTFLPDRVLLWLDADQFEEQSLDSDPAQRAVSRILLAIFQGDLEAISQSFNLRWGHNDGRSSLQLTPLDSLVAEQLTAIDLMGENVLEKIIITMGNGDRTEITLLSEAGPTTLTAAECTRFAASDCTTGKFVEASQP